MRTLRFSTGKQVRWQFFPLHGVFLTRATKVHYKLFNQCFLILNAKKKEGKKGMFGLWVESKLNSEFVQTTPRKLKRGGKRKRMERGREKEREKEVRIVGIFQCHHFTKLSIDCHPFAPKRIPFHAHLHPLCLTWHDNIFTMRSSFHSLFLHSPSLSREKVKEKNRELVAFVTKVISQIYIKMLFQILLGINFNPNNDVFPTQSPLQN